VSEVCRQAASGRCRLRAWHRERITPRSAGTSEWGEALCGLCKRPILPSCVLRALAPLYRPNVVPHRTNRSLKGLFRGGKWADPSCGCHLPHDRAAVPSRWSAAGEGERTSTNASAYRRRLRVACPAAGGVAPDAVARFTEAAARVCAASRPPVAAPGERAGCCRWERRAPDTPAATRCSPWFPSMDAGVLNRASMATR